MGRSVSRPRSVQTMKRWNASSVALLVAVGIISIGASAQKDPGPRPGPAGAGGPYPTLNANELNFFNQAILRFQEVNSVSGTIEDGNGLGPTFNGNSCAMCHTQPAIGGAAPGLISPQNPVPNPQVALATLDGATNYVPSFITANGPVREARFIRNPDGSLDGGVHDVFVITGRADAPVGCAITQPSFAQQQANHNVIFRIPTPTFGAGLMEEITDTTIKNNLASDPSGLKAHNGIKGHVNTNGNDGTVTRF